MAFCWINRGDDKSGNTSSNGFMYLRTILILSGSIAKKKEKKRFLIEINFDTNPKIFVIKIKGKVKSK